MWFNRYNSLNFKVNFFSEHAVASSIFSRNQISHNFFVNGSNISVMNVSCPVFKMSVQNVHQLQQHTTEVSFELTGMDCLINELL